MKKVFLIIFVNLILIISMYAQLNETMMVEKYNFGITENGTKDTLIRKGDWIIEIWAKPSMFQKEYAPARDFYLIVKKFHPNGNINTFTKVLGSVPFGERKFYDETGKLIKSINEDAKFGKIRPKDMVEILEKIGWINRKTGENVITDEILPIDGDFYRHLEGTLYIQFIPAEYNKEGKEIKPPIWTAFYMKYKMHYCTVNGNTGEYTLEEHNYINII